MNSKPAEIIFFFTILFALTSCLGDDDTTTGTSTDAQIYAFSLSNSDISELADITFTIDHKNGEIYNADSLAYGTEVAKVLLSITSNASYIEVMAEATNDTVYWSSSDSIDFSKPVKLKVYSYSDVNIQKIYTARLNVHQQDGAAFTWKMLTNKATNKTISAQKTILFSDVYFSYIQVGNDVLLYSSFDGGNIWLPQSMTGFPADADLMNLLMFNNAVYVTTSGGSIYQSVDGRSWSEKPSSLDGATASVKTLLGIRDTTLNAILSKAGSFYPGTTTDMETWKISENPIAANFPVTGFGSASNSIGLILVGGINQNDELLNTTWLTAKDLTWIQTTDDNINSLKKVKGPALVHYNKSYYLIGGKDDSGNYLEDMFVSVTNGVTWSKADSLTVTDYYEPRAYASILVVDDELMLFGGTGANGWLDDVWSGYLNEVKF